MKTIRVSAAVIHSDGKVYATRRGKGTNKGFWEFPGGKQEAGESGAEAAVREIREELGAIIETEKFLCTVEYQYPEFFLIMDCYLAKVVSGHLTLTEHSDALWLALSELDSVDWLPADIKVVEEIRKQFADILECDNMNRFNEERGTHV